MRFLFICALVVLAVAVYCEEAQEDKPAETPSEANKEEVKEDKMVLKREGTEGESGAKEKEEEAKADVVAATHPKAKKASSKEEAKESAEKEELKPAD